MATILHNSFYIGLIRIERTGETFQGIHPPLLDKRLFDRVQGVLDDRSPHKARHHSFRYQRLIRCSSCNRALAASRHKGHVYYRCQTKACPTTCTREECLDNVFRTAGSGFTLTDAELKSAAADIEMVLAARGADAADELRNLFLAVAAIDDRISRLTDAFVDQVVDREIYLARKERLLDERTQLISRKTSIEAGDDQTERRAAEVLELVKTLGNMGILENDAQIREVLRATISNLSLSRKTVEIVWKNPFLRLSKMDGVTCGGPHRIKPRTGRAHDVAKIIMEHCDSLPGDGQDDKSEPLRLAA